MKLRSITVGVDELPSAVTVTMTAEEALFVAHFIGGTNNIFREEQMRGGGQIGSDIYDCLTGSVFNRFYEDGVTDALRERTA